jgi:hypothetical protein
MKKIKLTLLDVKNNILQAADGVEKVFLDPHHAYALGDKIEVQLEKVPAYIVVQFDAALTPALVYVTEKNWKYDIPFNIQREWPYPDGAFSGKMHYLRARYATEYEISDYRNLAVNSHDQHDDDVAYPHATSNAETRGEYVFYAKNAIDGMLANRSHGNYPYQSWGINEQDDAEIKVDFGREVTVDQVGLVLRADYPHDSYWTEVTVQFSDDSTEVIELEKTGEEQYFKFKARKISWIKLINLIKDKDTSTFPALTEFEVFGK